MSKFGVVNKLVYILLPTFVLCAPVVLFNYHVQVGYPPQFPYNMKYWDFIEPFYRTFSHASKNHYMSNISILFFFSLVTSFFIRLRFQLFFYVLITIYSALIIKFYITGIGSSIIGKGIVGLLSSFILILLLKNIHQVLMSNSNKKIAFEDKTEAILILIILASWALMNVPTILEVIYIFDEAYLTTGSVIKTPSGFSLYSSIGHTLGYIFGFIYGINLYLINQSVYRFSLNFDLNN